MPRPFNYINPMTRKQRLVDWHRIIREVKITLQEENKRGDYVTTAKNFKLFLSMVKDRHHDAIAGTVEDKNGTFWDIQELR